jgi:hypothetical protein
MPGTRNWYFGQNVPQDPNAYTIDAHGNSSFISDESSGNQFLLSPEDLAMSLANDATYKLGTPIKLLVCDAGSGAKSFAQRLADLTNVPVQASPTTVLITQRGSYWSGLPYPDSTGQYGAPMYPVYRSLRVYTPSLGP